MTRHDLTASCSQANLGQFVEIGQGQVGVIWQFAEAELVLELRIHSLTD